MIGAPGDPLVWHHAVTSAEQKNNLIWYISQRITGVATSKCVLPSRANDTKSTKPSPWNPPVFVARALSPGCRNVEDTRVGNTFLLVVATHNYKISKRNVHLAHVGRTVHVPWMDSSGRPQLHPGWGSFDSPHCAARKRSWHESAVTV